LTVIDLTEGYFGIPKTDNEYKDRWLFSRYKQRVAWGIRRLSHETGLHIFSINKQGYVILEKPSDFDKAIMDKTNKIRNLQEKISLLRSDIYSTTYATKIKLFFEQGKILTMNEFNGLAKKKLLQAKIKKKYHK